MTKEQLAPWIDKLTKAAPKDRNAIVGDMGKENGLKTGAAWKLLNEAGFDPKAAPPADETPRGGEQQGAATRDNTGAAPGPAGAAQPSGAAPSANERRHETPMEPAKKRVKHEKLKGKNLIAGNKTIPFDADGIAELDAADAERLLTIPGYTEVK